MSATMHDSSVDALVERLADDMAQRWSAGERPLVEEYLERNPELREVPEAAAELIYEEVCLRQEYHEAAVTSDLLGRFPQWQAQLQILLDCHQLVQAGMAAPSFPEVGENLGDFHLKAELGRGAQGRVFLAKQPALSDRPIVVKLVPLLGREHLSLARMQHTHIVPLYFVQDFPERALRALCLPYFGGASLETILEAMSSFPLAQRSGSMMLEALRHAQAASPIALPVRGPACQTLSRASYVEAACWIGSCVADALQYAHERGVLHLDLKPANLLLAADGQPMLLDFHLARSPLEPGARPPDWLGGTPAYMAPEHRAAWESVREGRPVATVLDRRADLFGLGVLLHDMLSGVRPDGGPPADLQRLNPRVSRGLADIVSKCLAGDPQERYRDAAALAEDLRRHLRALPLRGVANRSVSERWRNWRRRRPLAPWCLGLLSASAILIGLVGWHVYQQHDKAQAALSEGRDHIQVREYEQAASALQHGIALVEGMPFSAGLKSELEQQLHSVQEHQAAREFHLFMERVRLAVGADALSAREAHEIEDHCRKFWNERERIALLDRTDDILNNDILDLGILWTRLRSRLAPASDAEAAHRDALIVLEEAERLGGPSHVLFRERGRYATALGLKDIAREAARQAAANPPHSAWEHAALGRALLDGGDPAGAAAQFDQALELRPNDFWASFHKGLCAHSLRRHEEAAAAFTVCLALAPESAWCHHNRALSLVECGQFARARKDFDRALQLDAHLADAYLHRGLLNFQEKRYDDAVADLGRALVNGANALRVRHGLELVLLHDPNHEAARALFEKLQGKL